MNQESKGQLKPQQPERKEPQKASSLIILRNNNDKKKNGLEILMLKRDQQLSWGGMTVFPGGIIDQQDNELDTEPSNKFYSLQAARIASIRQCFEQTGLFFVYKSDLERAITYFSNPNTQYQDFYSHYAALNTEFEKQLKSFIRLITPTFIPKRYDTFFFVLNLDPNQIVALNVALFFQEKKKEMLLDIDRLLINKSESSDFFWNQSHEFLEGFKQKRIEFARPTQFILCLIEAFQNSQDIDQYFNAITSQNSFFKGISVTCPLRVNPGEFPIIFQFVQKSLNEQKLSFWSLPGDFRVNLNQVADGEIKGEILNQQLLEKLPKIISIGDQRLSFYLDLDKNQSLLDCNIDFLNPLSLLYKVIKTTVAITVPQL